MFGFFLKKNFVDIWDNIFHFAAVNFFLMLLVFACGAAGIIISYFEASSFKMLLSCVWLCISLVLVFVFVFAEGVNVSAIANFDSGSIKIFFKSIPQKFKIGSQFALLVSFLIIVACVSIPYYFKMWLPEDGGRNPLGLLFLSIIFWFMVISFMALQWFGAVYNLMGNDFFKCLKKSYIIFFDNTGLTIALFFVNVLQFALSIITFGIIPGLNGISCTCTNALRILLYKYDWLEVNPGLSRKMQKDVPWDELLVKDRRTMGPRTFKSFIFPWKE